MHHCFRGIRRLHCKLSGGDMVSTWVAKLRVHAEGQMTSLIPLYHS